MKLHEMLAHEEGTFLRMKVEKEVHKLFAWDHGGSVDYLRRIPGSMQWHNVLRPMKTDLCCQREKRNEVLFC